MKAHWFQILLALADRDLHGLQIMDEVGERTDGEMHLWPGMLYGSLKRMLELGLVVETEAPAVVDQIPAITIQDGKVSIDEDVPCFIRDPDTGEPLAIIDTSGQFTTLYDTKAKLLLTESKLMIMKNEREMQTHDLSAIRSLRITREDIYRWLKIIKA